MSREFSEVLRRVLKGKPRRKSGLYRSLKDGDLANPIPLVDFLDGVGEMMRLPARVPEADKPAAPPAAASIAIGRRTRILLLVGSLAVVAYWVAGRGSGDEGTSKSAAATVPPEVLGGWVTKDPRYAGRKFEIANGFIVFKNGDRADEQSAHEISRVHTTQQGDSTLIRIEYLEAGTTYELSFQYSAKPAPGIRFSNQEELVWSRGMPDSSPQRHP